MKYVITHSQQKLTKFLLKVLYLGFLASLCASCQVFNNNHPHMIFPNGEKLDLIIAKTSKEHSQGLSGIKKDEFPKNKGMLFYYESDDFRQFWMPNTHFDLAIAFLDKNFKVLSVESHVPHHPSTKEPIPRTGTYWCRHVLEVRSDSEFAKLLKPGITLKLKKAPSDLER